MYWCMLGSVEENREWLLGRYETGKGRRIRGGCSTKAATEQERSREEQGAIGAGRSNAASGGAEQGGARRSGSGAARSDEERSTEEHGGAGTGQQGMGGKGWAMQVTEGVTGQNLIHEDVCLSGERAWQHRLMGSFRETQINASALVI
ncbi:hypothetical protein M758_1G327700 [Ceratodon purpureus]|nr:hypothetical protein M758_1G327700 [Ceratodon purpureus]